MGVLLDIAYAAGLAVSSPVWAYRLARTGKWRTDWRGRFGHCPQTAVAPRRDDRPCLLIHAVSVGEINAVATLVEQLAEQTQDGWRIVICSTTNTGIARAQKLFGDRHTVVRYPFDFSASVNRFLDAVHPNLVALVELEVWPNFMGACKARGIPVCVINGRLSGRSFKRYRLVRRWLAPMFAKLTAAAVQNAVYAQRFIALGTAPQRVYVTDTMKWDAAELADHVEGADELAEAMGIDRGRPLVVAGSTGPGEEELLIRVMSRWPVETQLLLAPRKPERFEHAAQLASDMVRRSEHPDGKADPPQGRRLFLLDTMGELRKAYVLADVVIVGRSFLGLYGSNLMEPAALGKPTIIGPHHSDFAHIVTAFRENDGVIVTDDPGAAAGQLLADRDRAAQLAENAREVILSRQGATRRHIDLLRRLMGESADA